MPQDPVEEWRRLTRLYSEMGDVEIEDIAGQINDLTPIAQDVLRDELKKREISAGQKMAEIADSVTPPASVYRESMSQRFEASEASEEDEDSPDYTWKVPLCECETSEDAWRLKQMLKNAGIDCWIESPGYNRSILRARIIVGADQLEQAKLVAQQPISQEVLDLERDLANLPEYENPTCPECGAPDPTLESVEPSNNWLCESCDHTWSDPVPENPLKQID